jgi:multimeric flavodoxin WrbA
MGKNIVVLSGSPRMNGSTELLVEAFVEGATKAGKEVTVFQVANLTIAGCLGCNYCFRDKGVCLQEDDMSDILEAIRKSDTLVFASPVYYFGFTGQLKQAIDRTYALLGEESTVKRTALLMTCGDGSETAAASSVSMYRQIIALQEWEEAGVIIAPGLHNASEIEGRPELGLAWALGADI